MKRHIRLHLTLFIAVLSFGVADAQVAGNPPYVLEQAVIASGGGQGSTGGNFSLDGTIGQPVAGTLFGGSNTLFGGFWNFQTNGGGLITVSGQITSGGNPLSGVIVSLSGSSASSAITDWNGSFSFMNLASTGSYTITPAMTNYGFTPPNLTFVNPLTNQTANFTAAAQNCSYSISPTSTMAASDATSGAISVTTADGCNWTAVSNDSWITVTSAVSGTNSGTVSYTVAANPGAQRTGTITVARQTFTVTQAAAFHGISGAVSYGTAAVNEPKYVFGVNLSVAGTASSSVLTDLNGAYLLNNLAPGSYTVTPSKIGDVNSITSFDASLAARKAANLISLSGNQLIAADASNDGTVSSFDASLIARTSSGVANNGIAGQWKFVPSARNYSNLTTDQTAQNYEAILIGEVSGNWIPPSSGNRLANLTEAEKIEADREEQSAFEERNKLFGTNYQQYTFDEASINDKTLNINQQPDAAGIPVSVPSNASASNGTIVSIPITIGDTSGQGIFSYDFIVSFNQAVLTPASMSFDTSGTLSGAANFVITPNPETPGKLSVSGFGTQQLSGQGTLIFLRFNVGGAANAATALTFDSFRFNEGTPASMTTNGQFTVLGPTAASVSISGRVLTPNGRGVPNAFVVLTGMGDNTRRALTNPFGYYRFQNVSVGESYVVSIVSKRYVFTPKLITINEEITDFNFVAAPQ